ncbi:MAG: adenylosuccinate synthetase, partial [Chitinophagaceae bacterium]|nr:adenylosuccinate synthetase [Chitinophagaceae bacterium]
TELHTETGEALRKAGSEFGATTGRPRRCGWLDLVALNFACMVNGVTKLIMTKADVLDTFDPLQVCTAYRIHGTETQQVPFQMVRTPIEPVYQTFAGWQTNTSQVKLPADLPQVMQNYIAFINQYLGVPIKYVSNGPGRDQIVAM